MPTSYGQGVPMRLPQRRPQQGAGAAGAGAGPPRVTPTGSRFGGGGVRHGSFGPPVVSPGQQGVVGPPVGKGAIAMREPVDLEEQGPPVLPPGLEKKLPFGWHYDVAGVPMRNIGPGPRGAFGTGQFRQPRSGGRGRGRGLATRKARKLDSGFGRGAF